MWTFDRYQRWMEQNRDWTRPPPLPAVPQEREVAKPAVKAAPPPSKPAATDSTIEIPVEEDIDLAELAELARRIERRTP